MQINYINFFPEYKVKYYCTEEWVYRCIILESHHYDRFLQWKAMKSCINQNQFTSFMTAKPLVTFTVRKENRFTGNGTTSYTCSALEHRNHIIRLLQSSFNSDKALLLANGTLYLATICKSR